MASERRLPDLGSLLALPMMMQAVVSCGGRVDAQNVPDASAADSGIGTDASTPPEDAAPVDAGDAALVPDASAADSAMGSGGHGVACTDPIHVSIGGTINGSTCAGTYRLDPGSPCDYDSPSLYFYVDAPAGVAFSISSTTSLIVSGYDACTDTLSQSCGGTPFAPTASNLRLFTVQYAPPLDAGTCGDFTITIVGQ